MPIELKMPALSPTMEAGTLAKWLVKEGDIVASGDILAEIETDKATMEFEAVDEGRIETLLVAEGTEGVKVGTTIATMAGEDDAGDAAPAVTAEAQPEAGAGEQEAEANAARRQELDEERDARAAAAAEAASPAPRAAPKAPADRVKASPLARRLAAQAGIDLSAVTGSGPHGRIVKADLAGAPKGEAPAAEPPATTPTPPAPATPTEAPASVPAAVAAVPDIPHRAAKLSSMRKVIARRLAESKQTVPHIYLTVDVNLDALLRLRGDLNKGLEERGIKLSVNDLLIKALAVALIEVPACNVMLAGDQLVTFERADISVAVSIPNGLITPIVKGADAMSVSAIASSMKALAEKARAGKLQPDEYQGGTASLSNMGMYGIKQFDAVINPPQGMILAIGAGEKRPYVVDGELTVATVMSATGSFDHRAIDGADGAQLMAAFKRLVENPLGMLA